MNERTGLVMLLLLKIYSVKLITSLFPSGELGLVLFQHLVPQSSIANIFRLSILICFFVLIFNFMERNFSMTVFVRTSGPLQTCSQTGKLILCNEKYSYVKYVHVWCASLNRSVSHGYSLCFIPQEFSFWQKIW